MNYTYTAIFTKDEKGKYYARIPDLKGCITTGKTLTDAIEQITDAASGWLVVAEDAGDVIPDPTPQAKLKHPKDAELSIVRVDTIAYRIATDTRAVRKNVSLPAWMAALADKRNISCSQVLQEGLLKKLS